MADPLEENPSSESIIQDLEHLNNSINPLKVGPFPRSFACPYGLQPGPIYDPNIPALHQQNLQQDLDNIPALCSAQPPPEFWCSIWNYRNENQVGNIFKVASSLKIVTIHSYKEPLGGIRFDLGAKDNVHRADENEKTTLNIAQGAQLELDGEGDVWLRCLSNHSVFVQTHYLDQEAMIVQLGDIREIGRPAYLKVFDLSHFYLQIQQQAAKAQAAPGAQSAGHIPAAGIGLDDLRMLCILRLSFVKGWGPDYSRRRQSIKQSPYWIEVHFHRALQLLDEVLPAKPIDGARTID